MNSLAQINDTNLKIFDEICAERISAINLDVLNLANIDTTRGEDGKVYRRKTVVFAEKNKDAFGTALAMQQARRATTVNGQGVKVTAIAEDHVTALKRVYDPAHPDADEEGYVTYPINNDKFCNS